MISKTLLNSCFKNRWKLPFHFSSFSTTLNHRQKFGIIHVSSLKHSNPTLQFCRNFSSCVQLYQKQQGNVCKNYERENLEYLGKYFLKRMIKEFHYHLYPTSKEGFLSLQYDKERPIIQKTLHSLGIGAYLYQSMGSFVNSHGDRNVMEFIFGGLNTSLKITDTDSVNEEYFNGKFDQLEAKLGHQFKNRQLLIQAFCHPSHELAPKIGSCLRLAFIGDAVLDELLIRNLLKRKITRKKLDLYRRKILCNVTLGLIARKHGFYEYRIVGPYQTIVRKKSDADVFEAIIGAIYLDSGRNMDYVWKILNNLLEPGINELIKSYPSKS